MAQVMIGGFTILIDLTAREIRRGVDDESLFDDMYNELNDIVVERDKGTRVRVRQISGPMVNGLISIELEFDNYPSIAEVDDVKSALGIVVEAVGEVLDTHRLYQDNN